MDHLQLYLFRSIWWNSHSFIVYLTGALLLKDRTSGRKMLLVIGFPIINLTGDIFWGGIVCQIRTCVYEEIIKLTTCGWFIGYEGTIQIKFWMHLTFFCFCSQYVWVSSSFFIHTYYVCFCFPRHIESVFFQEILEYDLIYCSILYIQFHWQRFWFLNFSCTVFSSFNSTFQPFC